MEFGFYCLYVFQHIIEPYQWLRAGFTFTNRDDIYKCSTCGLQASTVLLSSSGLNAAEFHVSRSPNCGRVESLKLFFTVSHRQVNEQPNTLNDNQTNQQHKSKGEVNRTNSFSGLKARFTNNVGLQTRVTSNCNNAPQISALGCTNLKLLHQHDSKNTEILYDRQNGIHMYPDYMSKERRIHSFGEWEYGTIQQPAKLVKAGFFSNGVKDQVICFSCGLWLAKWESNEVPIKVHARHSPKCAFLKGELSAQEIDAIQKESTKDAKEKTRNQCDKPMIRFEEMEITCTQEEILKGVCVKCKEAKITTVFADCGHRITCKDCSSKFPKCPYCGKLVIKTPVEAFH